MKRGTMLIVALLMAMTIMAQKTAVSGTVVDASTGEPVMGASVTADGLSVVTNADGFFTLKSEQTPEAVVVTHVGYRSRRVAVTDGQLTVRLQPTVIQLHEVLVMADNPRELVQAAIAKIPQNYSRNPELYNCFYRETAMKRQHYITVAEGVVSMYKSGARTGLGRDRVAINKGRRLLSPKQSDTLGVKVLGGPVAAVQLDIVKNRDFLLNDDDLACYELKMETPTTIADRSQYVVSLTPSVTMPYALYNGKLYIDQETLAFTRVELSLDMNDRQKATEAMLVRKPLGVRFRPRELSLLVDYRQGTDGVMRLSYMRTTFRFNCDWKRRLFATSFTATCEMAVTSTTDRDVQPIRGRDSFDQRDAFFDKVDYFRDSAFWQDYNIIEPTESLDKAVLRLLKKY
ncbi:MAG: carboxypeptidase-like regulatory domain-containing protein [Prevotella sp.]|nr:carboxypeptidase-like regulatory domain-containing protein [Prevotella sp.]